MNLFSKPDLYYKIVNSNFGDPFNQLYSNGYNEYSGKYTGANDGIYVTDIEHVFAYLGYGTLLYTIAFPSDSIIGRYNEKMCIWGEEIPGWYSDKIVVVSIEELCIPTIKKLIEGGADIKCDNFNLFRWALHYNLDVWQWLLKEFEPVINDNAAEIFA